MYNFLGGIFITLDLIIIGFRVATGTTDLLGVILGAMLMFVFIGLIIR